MTYEPGWQIADHVCRECLGRLLFRAVDNQTEVICANCEERGFGDVEDFCWCGWDCGDFGKRVFECFRNPKRTQTVSGVILVREREKLSVPKPPRETKPVFTNSPFDC
jgi:hypothetical protein